MPIYVYACRDGETGCDACRDGFDMQQSIRDNALQTCPHCGAAVCRVPVAPSLGRSQAAFDDRAKAAGFSKLKRIGKGEYEKQY